jgi:two-component sensor histidine kinase
MALLILAIQLFSGIKIYRSGITKKPLIAAAGLLTGSSSGFLVHLGAIFFGLSDTVPLVDRIISTGMFSSLWITAIYSVGTNYAQLEQKKAELHNSFLDVERSTRSQSVYLESLRVKYYAKLVEQANDTTGKFSKIIEKSKMDSAKAVDILILISNQVEKLDQLTQSIIKSEKKNKNQSDSSNLRNLRWRISDFIGYIRLSFNQTVVEPYVFALAIPTSIALPLSRILRIQEFLLSLVILAVAIFFAQLIVTQTTAKKFPRNSNLLSIFLNSLLIVVILNLNARKIVGDSPVAAPLKYFIAFTLVSIISLLYHAGRAHTLDVEAFIKQGAIELSLDRAQELENRQELSRINKVWLQHIHGTVKSKVYAAALIIEKAESSKSPQVYIESLAKARELLISTTEPPIEEIRSAAEEIQFRIDRWDGLVEIVLSVKVNDLDLFITKPQAYGNLIEEGITNAVRHGRCTSLLINIFTKNSGELVTEITDNGIGLENYKQGIGSALFEVGTKGNWSLTRDEKKNRTTLRLEQLTGNSR